MVTSMTSPITLVWTDLETEDLDENKGAILEVASVLTDSDLNVHGIFESLVLPPHFEGTAESLRLTPGDYGTVKMHAENGLVDALCAAYKQPQEAVDELRPAAVERRFKEFLTDSGVRDDIPRGEPKPYLAGSTVGFDGKFLRKYMPRVMDHLHYRVYDISVFKTEAQLRYPHIELPPKKGRHRGLPDILESIDLAKFLRAKLLQPVQA